jgi:ABC-type lipoprotein release transport system permease subunit
MREIDPKFELFDSAHVGAGNWIVGNVAGTEIARLGETRGTAREFKNSGNKARMLLKTKHITFFNAANQGSLAPIGAIALARSLTALLPVVSPTDPWTYAGASAFMAVVALAACWQPARRAAGDDPMVALRHE